MLILVSPSMMKCFGKRPMQVPDLPVDEEGFAHRRVVAETVGVYEAVGL